MEIYMTKEERLALIKKVARKVELKNKGKYAMSAAKNTRYRKESFGKAVDLRGIDDGEMKAGYGYMPSTDEDARDAAFASGALDNYYASTKDWD
jgi:hypothetical protein